jgi:hypothetical protein
MTGRISRKGWAIAGVGLIVVAAKKAKRRAQRARKLYVDEVSAGAKPIEGVGTAVAAFLGLAELPPFP